MKKHVIWILLVLFLLMPLYSQRLCDLEIEGGSIEHFQENYFGSGIPLFDSIEDLTPFYNNLNEYKNQVSFQFSAYYRIVTLRYKEKKYPNLQFGAGFTQRSFWDLFEWDHSSPFWDSNYEVSPFTFLIQPYRNWNFYLIPWLHQSNGAGIGLSRSWDRRSVTIAYNPEPKDRIPIRFELRGWQIYKSSVIDNVDIMDYMGWGDIAVDILPSQRVSNFLRLYNLGRFGLGFKYKYPPLDIFNNWEAYERYKNMDNIELSFYYSLSGSKHNISKNAFYVRWFKGYGENLLDYNQKHNTIRFGMIFFP